MKRCNYADVSVCMLERNEYGTVADEYAAGCKLGYIPGVEMYHLTGRATYSRNVIITYMFARYGVFLLFIYIFVFLMS